jgi:hypothetical protein
MKRSKKTMTVAVGLCWFVIISAATAQVNPLDTLTFKFKSPGTAGALSLWSTLVPVAAGSAWASNSRMGAAQLALIGSGIVIGPSVGYFYGGCSRKGLSGTIKRMAVAAFTAVVFESTREKEKDDIRKGWGSIDIDWGGIVGSAVGIIGCSIVAIHAVSDLAGVKNVVEESNQSLACRARINVSLTPAYFSDSDAAGMQLLVNF